MAATSIQLELENPAGGTVATRKLDQAAAQANVEFDTIAVTDTRPYEAIIDAATKRSCDLIVMASHGRSGIASVVLGSVTIKVLTHTKIPVLVCH